MNARVSGLLGFLEMSGPPRPELLDPLGKRIADVVVSAEFSYESPEGVALTEEGYSLGADAGLLVARLLQLRHPALQWRTARSAKTDLDYNLPVLTGFSGKRTPEPVRGGISATRRLAQRAVGTDAFTTLYRYHSELAP